MFWNPAPFPRGVETAEFPEGFLTIYSIRRQVADPMNFIVWKLQMRHTARPMHDLAGELQMRVLGVSQIVDPLEAIFLFLAAPDAD